MFDFITHYTPRLLSAAVTLGMSVILMMLSIPYKKEWKSFRDLRSFLAAICFLLSIANFVRCMVQRELEIPTVIPTFTLVVASYQAVLFTMATLVFMQSFSVVYRKFVVRLISITIVGALLVVSLFCLPQIFPYIFAIAIFGYVAQLIAYTYVFRKEYKKCIIRLEQFYDEEMSGRLRWVHHCFYSALVVGILALVFSIIPTSSKIYDLFILAYTAYYVYISGCVVNYRANANFIMRVATEAPADTVTEDQEEQAEDVPSDTSAETDISLSGEKEHALQQALTIWIENKRYTVKDTNLNDIAQELGTSQRLLSAFFSKHLQVSFRTWRNKLRIDEACRLLQEEENLLLKSLNEQVGMGDYSYFYKQFKATTGMSPTDYRNKYYHRSSDAKSGQE